MNKILENIINELNPVHDFDNIKFYNHKHVQKVKKSAKRIGMNLYFFGTLVKPVTRGGIVGGSLGVLVSTILGDSPKYGFFIGSIAGAYLDFQQYTLRGLYHYIQKETDP